MACDGSPLPTLTNVCVERGDDWDNGPCSLPVQPRGDDTCDSLRTKGGFQLTWLQFYRLNPGINCDSLFLPIPGVSASNVEVRGIATHDLEARVRSFKDRNHFHCSLTTVTSLCPFCLFSSGVSEPRHGSVQSRGLWFQVQEHERLPGGAVLEDDDAVLRQLTLTVEAVQSRVLLCGSLVWEP